MVKYPKLGIKLRAGYSLETNELKGCVIYLEGLGDSIRNHRPYFSRLNEAGYRVIFFDYMGQGGSEGWMDNTRIHLQLPPTATKQMVQRYEEKEKFYQIPEQADFFWEKYKDLKNNLGQDCQQSPKLVIGWSTGGLAAYRMAHEKRADAVVLLAPGLHPKAMAGESAKQWNKMLLFRQVITEQTLTRNRFEKTQNPHLDPIQPKSPAHVPLFAVNLLSTAALAKNWKINPTVRGLVFLSGNEDTYVDREHTLETLQLNAPHFSVKTYDGALHELDNETADIASDVYGRTIQFLNFVVGK